MAEIWTELVKRAVVGTTRDAAPLPALPPELAPLLAPSPNADSQSPEAALPETLLTAAAAVSLWRSAGRRPDTVAPASDADPAPALPTRVCSESAAVWLRRMLTGEYSRAMGVWLDQITGYRLAPPPHLAPGLLDLAGSRQELRPAVVRALGELGPWLARRNPSWRWVLAQESAPSAPPPIASWETGSSAERLDWLRQTRRLDSDAAREALAAGWSGEAAKFRAQALEVLAESPTAADEAFLEAALDDRSKQVRPIAAATLAALPGSALQGRLQSYAMSLLDYGPLLRRVTTSWPAELPAEWARDGIGGKPPPGVGERAWWLRQLVGAVPPSIWCAAWDVDPATILRADLMEWRTDLLQAWSVAAVRWQDRAWATALVSQLRALEESQFSIVGELGELLDPADAAALLDGLVQNRRLPPRWLLARIHDGWSQALAEIVATELQRRLRSATQAAQVSQETVEILCRAGLQMPSSRLLALAETLTAAAAAPDWLLAVGDALARCQRARAEALGHLDLETLIAAVDYPRQPLAAPAEALGELEFRLRIIADCSAAAAGQAGVAGAGPRR